MNYQLLQIVIPEYYIDETDERTVIYQIQIITKNRKWVIQKRYSQFEELRKRLKEYFPTLVPQMPKKKFTTFFTGKTFDELEERRNGLQTFMLQLIMHDAVINSSIFKEFIELKISELQMQERSHFLHGIRDFGFMNEMLFIVNSEMNALTRVDAYIQNMKLPWESEKGDLATKPVGCLECWIKDIRVWVKTYNSQAISLYIKDNIVLVGLDSGSINYLVIKGQKFQESFEIEQHNNRVMGIYLYGDQLHSISKDKTYRVLDMKQEILAVDYKHEHEFTCLRFCELRECAFIGDRCGSIFIFRRGLPLVAVQTKLQFIRDIYIDNTRNYLLAVGYQQGNVIVYDIKSKGNEQQCKEVTSFKNKNNSRCLVWSASRGEVFIGNDEGYLTIWNAKDCSPIREFKIHTDAITRMCWDEQNHVLSSASKDKTMKIIKIPKKWDDQIFQQIQSQDLEQWHK